MRWILVWFVRVETRQANQLSLFLAISMSKPSLPPIEPINNRKQSAHHICLINNKVLEEAGHLRSGSFALKQDSTGGG